MEIYNYLGEKKSEDFSFFTGSTYYALGDSITMNAGTKASPVTVDGQQLYGFTQYIEDRYGVVCTNMGESGHTIVQDYATLYAIDYTNVDLVTIAYGVNDGRLNVPIGERDSLDHNTFCGALGSLIRKIYGDNPVCRIIVCSPIQRLVVNNWGSYTQNSNGDTLEDFADACKKVANYYATPCADLFRNSGLNVSNLSTFTFDGVHPNNSGYNIMANNIITHIDSLLSAGVDSN